MVVFWAATGLRPAELFGHTAIDRPEAVAAELPLARRYDVGADGMRTRMVLTLARLVESLHSCGATTNVQFTIASEGLVTGLRPPS